MRWGSKATIIALISALIIIAVASTVFISDKRSTERFLDDFNVMNGHYKQALFQTGQENRETAQAEYTAFMDALSDFRTNYELSRPRKLQRDIAFNDDLNKAHEIAMQARDDINQGDLAAAHTTLEGIRPIFNEILRRNDLSLLSVALVDFHDSMEQVIEAGDAENGERVIEHYIEADARLKAVEAELNDTGVQAIRTQLDTMRELATKGKTLELPEQAAKLKTSYVKVYLTQK